MIGDFISAIPLGLILSIFIMFIIKKHQKKTGRILEKKKNYAILVLILYVAIMIQMTIVFRELGTIEEIRIVPFYREMGFRYTVLYSVANIVAFMPLGILLPIIWEKVNNIKCIMFIGFCGSMFIEMSQLILKCGVWQTEDLIMNNVGAGVGYWTYKKYIN